MVPVAVIEVVLGVPVSIEPVVLDDSDAVLARELRLSVRVDAVVVEVSVLVYVSDMLLHVVGVDEVPDVDET
eukprot:7311837-Pyramimonas_sp.AAC.1